MDVTATQGITHMTLEQALEVSHWILNNTWWMLPVAAVIDVIFWGSLILLWRKYAKGRNSGNS
jgi:hypothetical protein